MLVLSLILIFGHTRSAQNSAKQQIDEWFLSCDLISSFSLHYILLKVNIAGFIPHQWRLDIVPRARICTIVINVQRHLAH